MTTPAAGTGAAAAGLAAVAALVAEGVALAVRPLDGDSPLGPVVPGALVLLGTAVILALRHRRGVGGTLVTAGAVAAIALAYGGTPVVAPALVTWVAALAAAALRAQAPGVQAPGRPQLAPLAGGPARTPGRVVAVPVATTVVVTVVAALLLQLLQQQGQGGGPGGSGGSSSDPAGGERTRRVGTYTGGELDLTARGTLPATPLFDVPASSPQLWRTGTLTEYTGRSWEAESGETALTFAGVGSAPFGPQAPAPQEGPRFEDGDTPARARGAGDRELETDLRFRDRPLMWLPVTAPGRLRRADVGEGVAVVQAGRRALFLVADPARFEGPDGETARPSEPLDPDLLEEPPEIGGYRVRWSPRPDVGDPGLRAAPETAADVDEAALWTRLPESVPQRVRDLAVTLTRDASDRVEAARAVESYVNRAAEYTLEGPPLPEGADAADDLLFGSRQGFCEQFATAEAVLLRAVGIPARIATGWAGGTAEGDRRVVRAADAHAWVEVLVPGQGWVSSDPTAGARSAPEPLADRALALARDPRTWLAVVAVLVTVAAAVLAVVLVRRRRRPGPGGAPGDVLLAAYAEVDRALHRAGLGRAANRTLAEHTGDVLTLVRAGGSASTGSDLEPALASALDTVARRLYGATPPSEAESERAAATLTRFAAAVPQLVQAAREALATRSS